MVGDVEHVRAAAIAGEEKNATGSRTGEETTKVLVGRTRIAHMELDRLTYFYDIVYRYGAGRLVPAHDSPDEKISASELCAVFIDHASDVQPPPHEISLVSGCSCGS